MNDVPLTALDAVYVLDGDGETMWARVLVGDEAAFIESQIVVTYKDWRDRIRETAIELAQELGGFVTKIRRNQAFALH